ncbi:replication VP4-like protein [Rhizobium phage RHph_X94]|nr:replication VP4-like protein [Rhizobium phage RHph_TM1_10A]QWY82952.1 replication VP4-like protein [Rhizobium phage RHph_X94]
MCISPITVITPKGTQQAACRNCKRCRDNRIKDWVGRCIAESRTSVGCHSVTLTYAPIVRDGVKIDRHERTAVLTYSDVQKFFKRIRTEGFPVRYLVCGEFGKRKGRAHWHGILFWQEKVPEWVQLMTNFSHSCWPHGHMFWEKPSYRSVGYVCKYVQKDVGDEQAQGKLAMSKEPAIGGLYFRQLAKRYAEQGIAPQGPFYRFPGEAMKKNGTPIDFYMSGVTADQFRESYVLWWHKLHPERHLPGSDFVEEWMDRQVEEWRVSEKIAKLEVASRARALNEISEERRRFKEAHDLYHFGKNNRGLWDTEWTPEDEREEQEERATAGAAGTPEYIDELYRAIDKERTAQKLADYARYGTGTPF